MKVVVVGGVAGGMSFAARARRLCEDCEIVVLERGPYVSFANCGLPYYLGGEITERDDLLLHTPESLQSSLNLDVRPNSEVSSIDRTARTVVVVEKVSGQSYTESYDKLVLSTGAVAFIPPTPGVQSDRVHTLRNVPDVDAAMRRIVELQQSDGRAVVIGGGFIGLEAVEALRHRGIHVTLVELSNQVLPPVDAEMAHAVEAELLRNGVDVRTGVSVATIDDNGTFLTLTMSDGDVLHAGMVMMAVGVRTESKLARDAGLEIDQRGGVITDEHLVTSDPDIYAVGDVIEVIDAVSGQPALIPLAGPANRQGRAAANHLFGREGARSPVLGTAIVRVFDVVAATTGQNEKSLVRDGRAYRAIHLHPGHHAGYFPGAKEIHLKVLFDESGLLLGAQATGAEGVDKRIDVMATAIRAGMRVADLADLELAYAPPFGSAKDPINMAGFIGENVLAGDLQLWSAGDLDTMAEDAVILDVRSIEEYDEGHFRGATHIPHTELRDRIAEVPEDIPVFVHCASGFRSYLAARVLRQNGRPDVRSLDGGLKTFMTMRPDFVLER